MASRPAKEVLGISAMGVPLIAVEGAAASHGPGGLSRTSEVPSASSSAWSLPGGSCSAPELSSLSSSHGTWYVLNIQRSSYHSWW